MTERTLQAVARIFLNVGQAGNVEEREMFRTFNMGIGMVVVVDPADAEAAMAHDSGACLLGKVVAGDGVQL